MKHIFILFLILFNLTSYSQSEFDAKTCLHYGIKPGVKVLEERAFIGDSLVKDERIQFTNKGAIRLYHLQEKSISGQETTNFTIKYDSLGNCEIYDDYLNNEHIEYENTYWKDALLKHLETTPVNEGFPRVVTFTYNSNRQRLSATYYGRDGYPNQVYNYTYNEKGLIVSRADYCCNTEGYAFSSWVGSTFTYDKFFHVKTEFITKRDTALYEHHYFEYDSHGNMIVDSSIFVERINPKKISKPQTRVIHYSYDQNNLMVSKDVLLNNKKIEAYHFDYKLDERKNWIAMNIFLNDKLIGVKERTITYY